MLGVIITCDMSNVDCRSFATLGVIVLKILSISAYMSNWIDLAHDRDYYRSLMNPVLIFQVFLAMELGSSLNLWEKLS